MQYRIYLKKEDGGRYATAEELKYIALASNGRVWRRIIDIIDRLPVLYRDIARDITDEVVVEMWIGMRDDSVHRKKIFENDKVLCGDENGVFGEEYDEKYDDIASKGWLVSRKENIFVVRNQGMPGYYRNYDIDGWNRNDRAESLRVENGLEYLSQYGTCIVVGTIRDKLEQEVSDESVL